MTVGLRGQIDKADILAFRNKLAEVPGRIGKGLSAKRINGILAPLRHYKLRFHLAPPLFSRRDAQGHLVKQAYGPWIAKAYGWLAKAKGLRGTPFDLFGYTAERRGERAAIVEFETAMRRVVRDLTAQRLVDSLELARLPQGVRGFGHVKERNAEAARERMQQLMAKMVPPNGQNPHPLLAQSQT